jgi:hypothetical protein
MTDSRRYAERARRFYGGLGLSKCLTKDDVALIKEVAPYWHAYKLEHQIAEDLTDTRLGEALRELIHEHGYNLSDIAIMFGVSRERVRQWCGQHGVDHRCPPGRASSFRMWDAERLRFVPCSLEEYMTAVLATKRDARLNSQTEKRASQRLADVARVQTVGSTLGRAPYYAEVFDEPCAIIAQHWRDSRDNIITYSLALDILWLAAGYARPDGRAKRWRRA